MRIMQQIQKTELVETAVRFPSGLRLMAMELIKEGYFKNFSDVVISGVREIINDYYPDKSVLGIRKVRKELDMALMKKAKGDNNKLARLLKNEIDNELKSGFYNNFRKKNQ